MPLTLRTTASALSVCCTVFVVAGLAFAQTKNDDAPVDEQTQLNQALKKAASLGHVDEVKKYIAQGADVQWRDPADNGKTPLTKAVLLERFEVVKVLLENGADIHYPDGSGRYPILFCCIGSNVEQLKFLLAKGAGEDIEKSPFSVLVSVCDHGQAAPEFIPILIKGGADPNVFKGNDSPLIAAIKLNPNLAGRPEKSRAYIKLLIENGADVNLRNKGKEKLTPLQWAKKRGDQEIIDLLVKAGAVE